MKNHTNFNFVSKLGLEKIRQADAGAYIQLNELFDVAMQSKKETTHNNVAVVGVLLDNIVSIAERNQIDSFKSQNGKVFSLNEIKESQKTH